MDVKALNVEPGAYALSARLINGCRRVVEVLVGVAGDELVGVEARVRRHRHHRPGAGVEHHHRTSVRGVVVPAVGVDQRAGTVHALLERLLGDVLGRDVDGQVHVVARLGLLDFDLVDGATLVVDLDLLLPRRAPQLRFEQLLDAGLADGVGLLVAGALVRLELVGVDRPHVAEDVGRLELVRILALGRARHRDLWELVAVFDHVDGRVEVDVLGDRHGDVRRVLRVVDPPADLGGVDAELRRQVLLQRGPLAARSASGGRR